MNKFTRSLCATAVFWIFLALGFFMPIILGTFFPSVFHFKQETLLSSLTQLLCQPIFCCIGYFSSRCICDQDSQKCTAVNCSIAAGICILLLAIVGTVHLAGAAVMSCLFLICFAKTTNAVVRAGRMKIWAHIACLFASLLIISTISNVSSSDTPVSSIVFLAVAVCAIAAAIIVARKWSYHYAKNEFAAEAAGMGMTVFDYARRISPQSIIAHCEAQLGKPYYVVTSYLDAQAKAKQISRPCADALIEGYAELMQNDPQQ